MIPPAPAAGLEAEASQPDIYSTVVLALLSVGYTPDAIQVRTGVNSATFDRIAAEHGIPTDWHGTTDGFEKHIARGEEPRSRCRNAQASKESRALAQQRVRQAEEHFRARGARTTARPRQPAGGEAA